MKKALLLSIVCLAVTLLFAQDTATSVSTDTVTTTSVTTITQTFNVDSAVKAYMNMLTPEQRAKSDAYFEGGYWLQVFNLLYGFGVAFIFLQLGLGRWMKRVATKVNNVNLQNLIYAMLYILLAFVLSFPFSVYQDYFREHQYGLSNLTFPAWLIENVKSLSIGLVMGSLVIVALYVALRKTGKNWWLWGAGGAILFSGLIMFIAPVFLAPIFNDYKPLTEGKLKEEILSMARANCIPAENVYMFDASKQSKRVSANVSGIANTTRISLNDNLLDRCTPEEVKAVMGHEMGHYVLNHVYKGLLGFGVLIFIVFAIVNWLLNKIIATRGEKLGITSLSDIAGLPLLAFVVSLVFFVATPITNTMIRTQEMEADQFGLNAAREPDAEAHVDIMLSEYRKLDPGKWEEIFFFDHPSGRVRVETAMRWKAEHLNQ
ncbi:MAG: M48 family metallopeptidase [Chitinophagales bacterium]|nr:M48 family metallopeptidase [Chitinophagales bacterium]